MTCELETHLMSRSILYDLGSSQNVIRAIKSRRLRQAWLVARMGDRRAAYEVLVWRREGKRLLGRPRRRWKDNIIKYLQEVLWRGMNWIGPALDRESWRAVVNAIMNRRVS
jgi:hypothetical protein